MSKTNFRYHRNHLSSFPLIIAIIIICDIAVACKEEKKEYVAAFVDVETTPTMTTRNVETFISDSGITRYRIISPIWYIYDEAKDPNWKFPQGLFLEQYDDFFRCEATVVCDSAKYLIEKRLWQLDGHVIMVNIARDSFLTQQLFWNQNAREIYTDSFIHIVRADRIIEGYGLTSNEQMTDYVVRKPSAIFPVNDVRGGVNTVNSDTTTISSTGINADTIIVDSSPIDNQSL